MKSQLILRVLPVAVVDCAQASRQPNIPFFLADNPGYTDVNMVAAMRSCFKELKAAAQ